MFALPKMGDSLDPVSSLQVTSVQCFFANKKLFIHD